MFCHYSHKFLLQRLPKENFKIADKGMLSMKSLVCDEAVSPYSLVRTELIELAPVVQKGDIAIHWMNLYSFG